MYIATLAAVVTVLVAGVNAEDRTTSGLTQLLNPGSQGSYPPPAAPYPLAAGSYQPSGAGYNWNAPEPQGQQGFTVQSGYEGLIVPTGPAPADTDGPLHKFGGLALGASLLPHLLPFPFNKILLLIGTKLGLWFLGFLLLVLIGGATTTAVCAFTPICTISFLGFGFNREATRSLLTQDRLNTATQFVYDAIEKYRRLQGRGGKSEKKKATKKTEEDNFIKLDDLPSEGREAKSLKKADEVKEAKENKKLTKLVTPSSSDEN